jgi:hypothetical protein
MKNIGQKLVFGNKRKINKIEKFGPKRKIEKIYLLKLNYSKKKIDKTKFNKIKLSF